MQMSIKLFCTIKHFFALLNNRDAKVILTVFQKAPRSVRSLFLYFCDYVDLDEDVFGESFNGDAGACGLSHKIFTVDLVEGGEVSHIRKEADGFYRLGNIASCGFQYLAEVFADLLGLSLYCFGFDRTCCGIYGDLTRGEDQVSDLYGLRVGPDCLGGVFGIDFFTHFGFSFDGRDLPLPYEISIYFHQIQMARRGRRPIRYP